MNMHGIIFDMDELLVDSLHIWRAAEERMIAAMGHTWSAELARQYKGMSVLNVAATAWQALKPAQSVEYYQKFLRNALVEEYAVAEIPPMDGAVDLVHRLHGLAPMAVASGSPLEGIERAMQRLGIRDCFEVVLSSESVARGKPAPDVFLKAAELLGVDPACCLVFEDSLHGVRAALAAGMKAFAVPSLKTDEIPRLATGTFRSLSEVTREDVVHAWGSAAS
jgi:HAD superfamily hydrolase (TIGR01509 family)